MSASDHQSAPCGQANGPSNSNIDLFTRNAVRCGGSMTGNVHGDVLRRLLSNSTYNFDYLGTGSEQKFTE